MYFFHFLTMPLGIWAKTIKESLHLWVHITSFSILYQTKVHVGAKVGGDTYRYKGSCVKNVKNIKIVLNQNKGEIYNATDANTFEKNVGVVSQAHKE